jgi:hypothetical protein
MPTQQGSLELLQDPVAQTLLASSVPARVAYVWTDGTPRVVPIWFQWTGDQVVLGTPPLAPKVNALRQNPKVALTIDSDTAPYKVLMIRGHADVSFVDGIVPEYASAAERYYGAEGAKQWLTTLASLAPQMARVAITPEWVGILDFQGRFPNAIENLMGL